MARLVMRMPEPRGECSAAIGELVRGAMAGPGSVEGIAAPPIVEDVLGRAGQPLDASTRAFMEPRFGQDFGHVRVHVDELAARSSDVVGAEAYAAGSQIVFGHGATAPTTLEGKHLLAHELAHVAQQSARGIIARQPSSPTKRPKAPAKSKTMCSIRASCTTINRAVAGRTCRTILAPKDSLALSASIIRPVT